MIREEIIEAIQNDDMMPFLQDWEARDVVDFVLKNYRPSLPSNLDEAAEKYAKGEGLENALGGWEDMSDAFKAGAEWMAGQGVAKEAVIGMATEEISINVSQHTLNELDPCPGDKVVVQIRKIL